MSNGHHFSPSMLASSLQSSPSGLGSPNYALTPNGSNITMASPASYSAPVPRSLFSLTPAPPSGPTSLFSWSSSPTAAPSFDSSIFSPMSLASAPSNSLPNGFASPNFLPQFTPPKSPSGAANSPQSIQHGRTLPLDQRANVVTPSPFKDASTSSTPFYTPYPQPSSAGSSVYESPLSLGSPVSRVLQFDAATGRQKGKRLAEEEVTPPSSKRAATPSDAVWSSHALQDTSFRLPPFPMPSFDASSTPQLSPFARAGSGALASPSPNNSPTQSYGSAPFAQRERPSTPVSSATSSSFNSPQAPIQSHVQAPAPEPLNRQLVREPAAQRSTRPSEEMPLTMIRHSSVAVDPAYSSYNAALKAKSLLEDNEIDKWSPELARETFSVESAKVESAVEDLIANVNHTSDLLHQLNLKLHMSSNEILLMHAAALNDDRLNKLHKYFQVNAH